MFNFHTEEALWGTPSAKESERKAQREGKAYLTEGRAESREPAGLEGNQE
jgi:hypothetical protein